MGKSGVQEGLPPRQLNVHITASVFINDNEGGLLQDATEAWLEKLAPHAPTSQYRHNRTGEDNPPGRAFETAR